MKVNTSYMELCIHIDGGENLYLRVPTMWDARTRIWTGFVKTPDSKKLIYGTGKTSSELEQSFSANIAELMEDERYYDEVMGMFQPAWLLGDNE